VADFDDLVSANRAYADRFSSPDLPGAAAAGVGVVTCMDSRIDPLPMLGLGLGDAKVLRNPGARVDHATLEALVLAVHLLGVTRILVVPHTRCAVASSTADELRARVEEASGDRADDVRMPAVRDQLESLADDVQKIRTHRLITDAVAVGGFVYDVDTGLLERKF
jgi:carbonic anhydrase